MSTDLFAALMQRALDEAGQALASNDVPIGAVVAGPNGRIVGAAHNQREADRDPTAHAEMIALRQAATTLGSWRLDGCTLAVTLEPCTMCAGALVLACISRLVFGAWNEEMGAVGTLWDVVRDRRLTHRPEVISGLRQVECAALLQTFFATQRDSG